MSDFKACAVIPVFNHAHLVSQVFKPINKLGIHCIIVNDGGDKQATEQLRGLFQNTEGATLVEQFPNAGKGVAVTLGFNKALELGFSHAVQVDADGQHAVEDISKLLNKAEQHPDAVVTGVPLYDASVPSVRFYSRYITHCFVWLETLSFKIKDSMCGFRVYPLAPTVSILNRSAASRMDFDTNIIVRLFWRGVDVISVPTQVKYPENGVSNFRMFRDNMRISWMHTKLTLGMLIRLPWLLARKLFKS